MEKGRAGVKHRQKEKGELKLGEYSEWLKWILIYLFAMNALGATMMFVDKQKAKTHQWRTPERVLFLVSLLGGSLGTWAGMYLFRHKTKHWYFVIFMPLIFFAHVALLGLLYFHFQ